MSEAVRWLLAAFACYRLAQAIAFESWGAWLREWAGTYRYDAEGKATNLGEFVGCVYCVGAILALPCAALALWPTIGGDVILAILGIAGAQAWLQDERRARMRLEKDGR